jgi:hypothetical protein
MSDAAGMVEVVSQRPNTGKMKIRGVMARKGDTPEFVNRMQQEVSMSWPRQRVLRIWEGLRSRLEMYMGDIWRRLIVPQPARWPFIAG